MDCLFCNRTFRCKEELATHYRKHTGERPFLCPKCPQELASKYTLIHHLETHIPLKQRSKDCHLCGKKFINKLALSVHLKYHMGRNFECKLCKKKFTNPYSLKQHENYMHKNSKAFPCNICGKAFNSKRQLKTHQDWIHSKIGHDCSKCGRVFGDKSNLTRHLKQQHNPQREKFNCDKCPKSFLKKASYEEHRLIHQEQKYSFQCDRCDQRFLSSKNLNHHLAYFHLEKANIFICVFCEKQFPTFSTFQIHMSSHTFERPYLCKLCPEEFSLTSLIRPHNKRVHCKLREKFRCNMCPKAFLKKQSLENHIRVHMGELHYKCPSAGCGMRFSSYDRQKHHLHKVHIGKQFSCSVCAKQFLTKPQLKEHASVHSNFKGYHCNECNSSYKQFGNLKRHKRTVHA